MCEREKLYLCIDGRLTQRQNVREIERESEAFYVRLRKREVESERNRK